MVINMSERNTIQKQIIMDTLKSVNTHPSVEEMYAMIKEKHPSISKATVYRNMRQLAEKGKILQIAVANDVFRFDGYAEDHFHFICGKCNKIYDVDVGAPDDFNKLNPQVQEKYGFEVGRCVTSFFGVCKECK